MDSDRRRRSWLVHLSLAVPVISAVVSAACGGGAFQSSSTPSDVSGDYSVTLTNGANGCQFKSWGNAGDTTQDVHITVQQTGTQATGTVTGVAGLLFDAILGGMPQFQGTVTGNDFTMTAVGTNSGTDGQCSFTLKATLKGTLDGDAIQGTLTYAETTNGSPDCGYHATCSSIQSYAGVRAPDAGAGD